MNRLPVRIILTLLSIICCSQQSWAVSSARLEQIVTCYRDHLKVTKISDKFGFATRALRVGPNKQDLTHLLYIDYPAILENRTKEVPLPEHTLFDEGEHPYSSGMQRGFEWVSQNQGKKVDFDAIYTLHSIAFEEDPSLNHFSLFPFQFIWGRYKVTEEALTELDQSQILYHSGFISETLQKGDIQVSKQLLKKYLDSIFDQYAVSYAEESVASIFYGSREDIIRRVQPFLDYYNLHIQSLQSLDGKLMAIGELLRALEIIHPFSDGNQRTFAFLLLTQLLIENNIPPSVLPDPFIFNGYLTVQQIAEEIKKGIGIFIDETLTSQDQICPVTSPIDPSYFSESDYHPYFETLAPRNHSVRFSEYVKTQLTL